jgi:DNA-binding MarR family transcriptional regulator
MAKKKSKQDRHLHIRLHKGWLQDHLGDLDKAELKVYISIAMHADWNTGKGCPTFETIRKDTKLTIPTIRSAIKRLKAKKLIDYEFKRRTRKKDGSEYGRKRYHYTIPHPATKLYFREH